MRKIILLFALTLSALFAAAQRADTALRTPVISGKQATGVPKASVNWLFIAGLLVVIGGVLYHFILRPRQKAAKRRKSRNHKKHAAHLKRQSQPQADEIRNAFPENLHPDGVKKALVPAAKPVPEIVPDRTQIPENMPAEKALGEKPETPLPVPEIFYMTVPGADGRFGAGAKKMQPAGCLYRFEVMAEKPDEALLFFSGNEDDMRNAQAFRDLELLPACAFSGLPDAGSFRFTQKPGRAHFDGTAWVVQQKVEISFL